jgi:hypothetical protein
VDPPKLLALRDPYRGPDLTTFEAKARALAGRFFPNLLADLSDIQDPALTYEWPSSFEIRQQVTPEDILKALQETAPWKAPGEDLLPIGLLKACSRLLACVLVVLAIGCLRLG